MCIQGGKAADYDLLLDMFTFSGLKILSKNNMWHLLVDPKGKFDTNSVVVLNGRRAICY